jgi:hypothetical protein
VKGRRKGIKKKGKEWKARTELIRRAKRRYRGTVIIQGQKTSIMAEKTYTNVGKD